jgi:hypothetical protein
MKKYTHHPIPPLPPEAGDEEIIHWVDTHDVIDRLKAGVSEIVEDHSDKPHLEASPRMHQSVSTLRITHLLLH